MVFYILQKCSSSIMEFLDYRVPRFASSPCWNFGSFVFMVFGVRDAPVLEGVRWMIVFMWLAGLLCRYWMLDTCRIIGESYCYWKSEFSCARDVWTMRISVACDA